MIIFVMICGLLTIYFAWHDIRQQKKIRVLEAEIRHTKHNQYFRELGYDPDECEDCHLPGDCPLCGGI